MSFRDLIVDVVHYKRASLQVCHGGKAVLRHMPARACTLRVRQSVLYTGVRASDVSIAGECINHGFIIQCKDGVERETVGQNDCWHTTQH